MYICDDRHTWVCYAGLKCPMCILLDDNETLAKENSRLIDKIDELDDALKSLLEENKNR